MFVLIGMPVYKRDWILPTWFDAIERQDWPLDQIGFIFEVASDDHQTTDALLSWHGRHPEVRCFDLSVNTRIEHVQHPDGHRTWNLPRYQAMAEMRNRLLELAVCRNPDRYFSLDSDMILMDPTAISQLVSLTESLDAVAPLAYMTQEGIDYPNVMTFIPNTQMKQALRFGNYPLGTVFKVDVIMGAKMMTRPVYQGARYRCHSQGEDLGWSANCAELHFQLWSASHLYASHVMHPSSLGPFLASGDSRRCVANSGGVEAATAGAVVVGGANP